MYRNILHMENGETRESICLYVNATILGVKSQRPALGEALSASIPLSAPSSDERSALAFPTTSRRVCGTFVSLWRRIEEAKDGRRNVNNLWHSCDGPISLHTSILDKLLCE